MGYVSGRSAWAWHSVRVWGASVALISALLAYLAPWERRPQTPEEFIAAKIDERFEDLPAYEPLGTPGKVRAVLFWALILGLALISAWRNYAR